MAWRWPYFDVRTLVDRLQRSHTRLAKNNKQTLRAVPLFWRARFAHSTYLSKLKKFLVSRKR